MTTVTTDVQWDSNMAFKASAEGHELMLDVGEDQGGENRGPRPKASRQRPRGGRRAGARPIGGCLTASDYSMTPPQVPPTTVLRRARPEPPAASGKVHARDDQRDTNMATKSNPARGARHQEWLEPLEACPAQSL